MDIKITNLIQKELDRQRKGLELIASENFASQHVLDAMGSCLTNKYAEGYPGKRYYGGCEVVDEIEQLAIDRLKKLFGAEYANVQPHSGTQANVSVYLTLLQPGDTILGFNLSHGGHLSHGSPVNYSGRVYHPVFYGVNRDTGLVDMDQVEEIALREKPKLIICGASAYSRDWDYAKFRMIADQVNAFLMADIAHPAGLVASKLLADPLPHCHIVTSTTHKTLRGPRGGFIIMGRDFENPWGGLTKKGNIVRMSALLNSGVFPGMQGGPLEHVIAAKAIAFEEALDPSFIRYSNQVIENSRAMASAFISKGYHVVSGGTDNHLLLIDLRSKQVTGRQAENALVEADITVNKNMVPFDDQTPFVTSGIRIGTAAITTRGLGVKDCTKVVEWIDQIIKRHEDTSLITEIKTKVNRFMEDFPLYEHQHLLR